MDPSSPTSSSSAYPGSAPGDGWHGPDSSGGGWHGRPQWPGFRTTRDHALRLNVWNVAAGVTVTVTGAVGADDGTVRPFLYSMVPTTGGVLSQQTQQLEDGILLWCQVFASAGTPLGAQTYARLELVQGSTGALQSLGTIVKGYLTSTVPIFYPGDGNARAVDGRGTFRSVLGNAPAAAAEISDTVPTNRRWTLQSACFELTTSATVANRTPVLTIDDGANIIWEASNNIAVTATQTAKYRAGAGVQLTTIGTLVYQLALPEPLVLQAGFRIRTVSGLAAGDQYTAPRYDIEEWFDV